MEATIEISGPLKRFDATVALDGMGFTVARPGEVDGLADPGGAGQSAASALQAGRSGRGRLPRLAHCEGLSARRADGTPPPNVPS